MLIDRSGNVCRLLHDSIYTYQSAGLAGLILDIVEASKFNAESDDIKDPKYVTMEPRRVWHNGLFGPLLETDTRTYIAVDPEEPMAWSWME